MEILRPGDKNRVECGDCGSLLQFTALDIGRVAIPPHERYDEEDPTYAYKVLCPSCENSIDVTNKVSTHIAKIVTERTARLDYDL
jgi:ribosomal protein S27E